MDIEIRRFCCHAQMNIADSERMAGCLESVGYQCCEDPSDAGALLLPVCKLVCVSMCIIHSS